MLVIENFRSAEKCKKKIQNLTTLKCNKYFLYFFFFYSIPHFQVTIQKAINYPSTGNNILSHLYQYYSYYTCKFNRYNWYFIVEKHFFSYWPWCIFFEIFSYSNLSHEFLVMFVLQLSIRIFIFLLLNL